MDLNHGIVENKETVQKGNKDYIRLLYLSEKSSILSKSERMQAGK